METPSSFAYFDIKEGSENLSILQISGFSGVGKSYLMYELALMLLAKPTVFRVLFLGHASSIREGSLYSCLSQFLSQVFPDFLIPWSLDNEEYCANHFFKNAQKIKNFCFENKITFIVIIDQVNELYSNGRNGSVILETLSKFSQYCYKVILCYSPNNQRYKPLLTQGKQIFLASGFTEDEAVTFLRMPYKAFESAEKVQFSEQLLENIRYHSAYFPLQLSNFKREAKAQECKLSTDKNFEQKFEYLWTSFCQQSLYSSIRHSFKDFIVDANIQKSEKYDFYTGIYSLKYELPVRENVILNQQYTYRDSKNIVRGAFEFVDYIVGRMYDHKMLSSEEISNEAYLKAQGADNSCLGIVAESVVKSCLRREHYFSFSTLHSDSRMSIVYDEKCVVKHYDHLFEKMAGFQNTTLIIPSNPTFKYADFMIVRPEKVCYIFQVSVNISRHSPSAKEFAYHQMEKFRRTGISKFYFFYIGSGKRVPKADELVRKMYRKLELIPFNKCNHKKIKRIIKSPRWLQSTSFPAPSSQ